MNKIMLAVIAMALLSGCDSTQKQEARKRAALAGLTCGSVREGRSQEELQAIGDACFRKGTFSKSSGQEW